MSSEEGTCRAEGLEWKLDLCLLIPFQLLFLCTCSLVESTSQLRLNCQISNPNWLWVMILAPVSTRPGKDVQDEAKYLPETCLVEKWKRKDLYPSVHSCFIPAQLEITQMSIDVVNGLTLLCQHNRRQGSKGTSHCQVGGALRPSSTASQVWRVPLLLDF